MRPEYHHLLGLHYRSVDHLFYLYICLGLIQLYFSEIINASTFLVDMLTLTNKVSQDYSLIDSIQINNNSDIALIQLSTLDSNNIKMKSELATDANSTFLAIGPNLVMDMNGVFSNEISLSMSLQVSSYTPDSTRPLLYSNHINLTNGIMTLIFSETMRVSSGNLFEFALHSIPSSLQSLTLSGGMISPNNSPTITISLNMNDLNLIKKDTNFATNISNIFYSFTQEFIRDMAENSIIPINQSMSSPFDSFNSDLFPPSLTEFSLDMDDGILYLTFSETVRVNSVHSCRIILTNSRTSTEFYNLSNFSSTINSNYHIIPIQISTFDLNSIKLIPSFVNAVDNTYLFQGYCMIIDMNGNLIQPIFQMDALKVNELYPDISPPSLLFFSLNLSSSLVSVIYVYILLFRNAIKLFPKF